MAIPEVRQHLFAAAERVLVRDGPAKLSGRAVTGEAGVATGLLYAHFADFDEFLVGYAVDRAFQLSATAAALPRLAGSGDPVDNLCDALLAAPPATLRTLTRLYVLRPGLTARVHAVLGAGTAGLAAVEHAAADYLAGEQRLGRLAAEADPEALALAVVGVLHHLVLAADDEADLRPRIERAVSELLRGCGTASAR